jgi:hypothetical protein
MFALLSTALGTPPTIRRLYLSSKKIDVAEVTKTALSSQLSAALVFLVTRG